MPDYSFHEKKAAAFNAVCALIDSLSPDNVNREKCKSDLLNLWEQIDVARDWEVVQKRLQAWINPHGTYG